MACRQLGSELHELHPVLPLFDGVTGQAVPQHVDNRVERLRDALMDDARERVDDLGEDLVVGLAPPHLPAFMLYASSRFYPSNMYDP